MTTAKGCIAVVLLVLACAAPKPLTEHEAAAKAATDCRAKCAGQYAAPKTIDPCVCQVAK